MRAVILLALLAGTASAQDALTGQPGCALAWDFSAKEQPQITAFPIWLNGSWVYAANAVYRAPTSASSSPAPTPWKSSRATPESGKQNSVRVKRAVEIQPPKPTARVTAPTNLRML